MNQQKEVFPQDFFGGLRISRTVFHIHYPGKAAAPKGYILQSSPAESVKGERLEVTLFGDCCQHIQAIISVLQGAGQKGLTSRQSQFEIVKIETVKPVPAPLSGPFPLRQWHPGFPALAGSLALFLHSGQKNSSGRPDRGGNCTSMHTGTVCLVPGCRAGSAHYPWMWLSVMP